MNIVIELFMKKLSIQMKHYENYANISPLKFKQFQSIKYLS
jgi:hypothetical protein